MKKPLFLFLLTLVFSISAYTQHLPNTLLWRISGNGLQKPSYLYGTLHLTDERLSVLGDSLIQAIKNSDGFALEVDPAQMSPMVVELMRQQMGNSSRIKNVLSKESYKRFGPALAKTFKKPADEITTDDILTEKNKLITRNNQKDKMVTFLDGYLCHLAYNQGKWIGGVEDYTDQVGLVDNMVDESDIRQLAITGESSTDSSVKTLIRLYLNADLNSIDAMMNLNDSAFRDKLLVKRNIRMASRMDSLSRIRTMVFAVGAAHLGGEQGLIQILKNKGFRVDPVFYSKKLTLKEYQVPERQDSWVDVNDPNGNYQISMPGMPANLLLGGLLQMKVYYDVYNNSVFMVSSFTTPYSGKGFDSTRKSMAEKIFYTRKDKDVVINGIHGKDYEFSDEGSYRRGYILDDNNEIYLVVGVAENTSAKSQEAINHFIHSFEPRKVIASEKSNAYIYTDSVMAFSVDLPSKPQSGNDLVKSQDKSIGSNLLVCPDQTTGSYLMFSTNYTRRGYYMTSDSIQLASVRNVSVKKLKKVDLDTMYLKGNRRIMEINGEMADIGLNVKSYYLFRGNRYYALLVMYKKGNWDQHAERFLNSLRLLDYSRPGWTKMYSNDSLFSIWSPSSIKPIIQKADGANAGFVHYSMYDTSRSNSYDVLRYSPGKYYWQRNDSLLLRRLVDQQMGENDCLLYEKPVHYKDLHGVDFAVMPRGTHSFSRKLILVLGDSLLVLTTSQQIESLHDSDMERFFTEFKYNRTVPKSNILKSKAGLIISDLSSNDSTTRKAAGTALKDAPFETTDIPALCDGLLKISEFTESDYETNQIRLTNQIVKMDDSYALSFSRKYYPRVKNGAVKDDLLYIMCARQTKNNYDSIAQLMIKFPLPDGPGDDLLKRFKNTDSMSAVMYPAVLVLLKDTNNAAAVINLFNYLLDSNKLSISLLQNHERDILDYAEMRLDKKQKDPDNYNEGDKILLELIGKLNSAKGNAMIKQWLSIQGNEYLLYKSVQVLLRNNQEVSQQALVRLAKDRNYRTYVYDILKEHHKQTLFPVAYRTQNYFAESMAYSQVSDDDDPTEFKLLGEKKLLFKGKYYRFFFYKYSFSDTSELKLVCAGPFSLDPSSLSRDIASVDVYEGPYSESEKQEEQEKALVRQMEVWYNF